MTVNAQRHLVLWALVLEICSCAHTRPIVVWTGARTLGPVGVRPCEVSGSDSSIQLVAYATSDECRTDASQPIRLTAYGPNGELATGRRSGTLSPNYPEPLTTDPIPRAKLAAFGERVTIRLVVSAVCETPPGGSARGGVDCFVTPAQRSPGAARGAGQ